MLLDKNQPLFLRWSYLPRLLPWMRKYLAHANDADARRIADSSTAGGADACASASCASCSAASSMRRSACRAAAA